jgi:hypothetical protein
MISIPLDLLTSDRVANFGATGVRAYDPVAGAYLEPATVERGAGYWIGLTGNEDFRFRGQDPTDSDFRTPMQAGWNLFGNPYGNDVLGEDVDIDGPQGRKDIIEAGAYHYGQVCAWGWNGSTYYLVHPLLPLAEKKIRQWEGYWYKSGVDGALVIPAKEREGAREQGFRMFGDGDWCLRLEVKAGGLRDTDNFLGVSGNLTRANEALFNVEEPPLTSPYLDLYFPGSVRYATSFLPRREGRLEWQFEVQTDLGGDEITLAWPNLVEVPKRYNLTLVDEDTGERRHMRTSTAYVFTCAPASVRHFRLTADPSATGTLGIGGLHWAQTRAGYSLNYTLSKDAAVTVEILTLAGALINTLTDHEPRSAGENSLLWNGRDARGSLLPAGSYLCQVSADTEEGERIQALTTVLIGR